jgi:hypothetical protein
MIILYQYLISSLLSCHIFDFHSLAIGTSVMKASTWVLPTLLAQLPTSFAAPNCPLLGPEFPPPQRLSAHPTWKKAVDNITAVFDYIDTSNITGVDTFSYSIQIFSTNPGPPILWERHRTAKDLPANTTGVKKVDGDTVYRLGSVSKAFTVLAFLAEVGDVHWNQPITKYIPELANHSARSTSADFDSVRETDWDDITIGALASQVSGVGRDCMLCSMSCRNSAYKACQMVYLGRLHKLTMCLYTGSPVSLLLRILPSLLVEHGHSALGKVSVDGIEDLIPLLTWARILHWSRHHVSFIPGMANGHILQRGIPAPCVRA